MLEVWIDGRPVGVPEGSTVLDAARAAGVSIPTLCYLKGINDVASCRVCLVELEDGALVPSCSTPATDGLHVKTSTPRVRQARKLAVELILSHHNYDCPNCISNMNGCELQALAERLGVRGNRLHHSVPAGRPDSSSPSIIRDPSKCILCYRCVNVCRQVQGIGVWEPTGTGLRASIQTSQGSRLGQSDCTYCGQCVVACPTAALHEVEQVEPAWKFIGDQRRHVVAQVAPAVRTAYGEEFHLPPEVATPGRLVAALKRIGFDRVFDTAFTADLTVIEEASELVDRLGAKESLPLFTSCCPGWVRFVRLHHPELTENLSSCKSPQQMFGALAKTRYAEEHGLKPEDVTVVSIMPCTSKKFEAGLSAMQSSGHQDVDLVLTTRELCRMIRESEIDIESLPEEEFDDPLGMATGAGEIFGASGGVMEAALRTAHYLVTGANPDPDAFEGVRSGAGTRIAEVNLGGNVVRVGVAHGLKAAEDLIERLQSGELELHFVEVMACPGGCVSGGGQPIPLNREEERRPQRTSTLYKLDRRAEVRFAHESPTVQKLYDEFLGKPGSHKAHELLHTDQEQWQLISVGKK